MVKIAIIGLGYVGLPLAVEFSKQNLVVGYDINIDRVNELKNGFDRTFEIDTCELYLLRKIEFTTHLEPLNNCKFKIVTVPTPVDKRKAPELSFLKHACETVGKSISRDDIVIFESTVYPGLTEEICIPIIEEISGLKRSTDFFYGYSPERINPGDKTHRLKHIKKVVSGCCGYSREAIRILYSGIIDAGVHVAPSVQVAEAAKVIENTQRDLNIALMNELSIIFDRLGLDTKDVLEAAGTKWNFLKFTPGLVGGHCVGVDPYYLTYKAMTLGITPKVILAGREINDQMPEFITLKIKALMLERKLKNRPKILIMGATFKENCPDIRNSKSIELGHLLSAFSDLTITDPNIEQCYGGDWEFIKEFLECPDNVFDIIILAVPHVSFVSMGVSNIKLKGKSGCYFIDLKSVFEKSDSDWRL